MRFARQVLLASALAILPLSQAQAASILVNGGFEAPNVPVGFTILAAIPGWTTVAGPGIEIQDHVAGSPYEGDQFVELDSTGNTTMAQSVATVAGEQYALSFAYSPRPGVGAASNGINLYWNGVQLDALTGSGIGVGNTMWHVYTYMVTAAGPLSELRFAAVGTSDSLGGYLDAVSLEAVPEPGTLALLGLALAGMVARRSRT